MKYVYEGEDGLSILMVDYCGILVNVNLKMIFHKKTKMFVVA